MPAWPPKFPSEDKSYGVDWTNALGARTIASSDFTIKYGSVTLHAKTLTGAVTACLVRGGVDGESVELINTIVLDDNQTWEEPCYLQIADD